MLTHQNILPARLAAQHIVSPAFNTPAEIVAHLGAVQAQEFAMAKWSIGLRSKSLCEKDVDEAFNAGKILRTHLLRPTWHFVTPEDIGWLLKLTAPRVHQANAFMYRQSELDNSIFKRSHTIITKTLEGGNHLTREELQTELARKKIKAEGFRLAYIVMHAELEGLICSGRKRGNQFTYALIDEWIPKQKSISQTEALVNLTLRYFKSRGPATANDLKYWSGLTSKEVTKGIHLVERELQKEVIDGEVYFFHEKKKPVAAKAQTTFLMADYDEFGMSYKDKDRLRHPDFSGKHTYNRMVVVDGYIAGSWKRTLAGKKVLFDIRMNIALTSKQKKAVIQGTERFADFINKDSEIAIH